MHLKWATAIYTEHVRARVRNESSSPVCASSHSISLLGGEPGFLFLSFFNSPCIKSDKNPKLFWFLLSLRDKLCTWSGDFSLWIDLFFSSSSFKCLMWKMCRAGFTGDDKHAYYSSDSFTSWFQDQFITESKKKRLSHFKMEKVSINRTSLKTNKQKKTSERFMTKLYLKSLASPSPYALS